jgi:hypothetical protein
VRVLQQQELIAGQTEFAVGRGLLLDFQRAAVIDPPELAQVALTH